MLLVQRQNSNVEDKSQSVLFIVETKKIILTRGVLILNTQSGPMDKQVLMCRYQPVLTHMLEI